MRLILLGILLAILVYAFATLEQRAMYFPDRQWVMTPDQVGLSYESVSLKTSDEITLDGWFIPAKQPNARVLLFFHGNAGNISHRLDKVQGFHQLGLSVLLIDYRGYGRSQGKPSERGTYLDAEAAYRYLTDTRKVPAQNIILYGESLGCAVAVETARRFPAAAVILESPFTSSIAVGKLVYPWLPVRWMVRYRYDNLAKIAELRQPLLILHSPEDEIIPFAMGRQLYEAARMPKTFFELSGGHNDAYDRTGPRVYEAIRRFLL